MQDEQREGAHLENEQGGQEADNQTQGTGEEQTTEGGGELDYESLKQKYEEEKRQRQGLVDKVKKMEQEIKGNQGEEKQGQAESSSNLSEERLDKIELKQVDPNLNQDEMKEILTIKKAKGLQEATDAYNDPVAQAFLKDVRAQEEKKGKTEQAAPNTQPNNASASGDNSPKLKTQSKNWNESLPGDSTEEMAKVLKERYFGNK